MKCIWCKSSQKRDDLIVHTCRACVEVMIRHGLLLHALRGEVE